MTNDESHPKNQEHAIDFLGGFVVTGVLVGMLSYLGKSLVVSLADNSETLVSGSKSTGSNQKEDSNQAETVARFPWEPKPSGAEAQQPSVLADPSNPKKQSEQEQLHFLAQMSFANGGMRAPSCPCCF